MTIESGKWIESSDHRLEADEIQGRTVVEKNKRSFVVWTPDGSPERITFGMYGIGFPAIRYCLIDPPTEEPMELYGVKPEVKSTIGEYFYCVYGKQSGSPDIWFMESPVYETRAAAIRSWNEFVSRLK